MDTKKKKEQFLEALRGNGNIICKACEAIGIDRGTYYHWKKTDTEFAKKCADMEEVIVDLVESSLMKRIKDGDTTATIFFLKTKGKHRGYVEKTQVEGTLDTNVRISYVDANNVFASDESEVEE